ncbi:hypothetical protein GQ42DRAFT_160484 [Ramicandelaber brevisporus]|nr:hypothetical protein GQ42DRAFT_160484 [Ramicandelaber brevisporus]
MSSSPSRVFKVTHNGVTRRLVVAADKQDWSSLSATIAEVFGLESAPEAVTYVDSDNDTVTISTERELQDYYHELGSDTAVARVTTANPSEAAGLSSSIAGLEALSALASRVPTVPTSPFLMASIPSLPSRIPAPPAPPAPPAVVPPVPIPPVAPIAAIPPNPPNPPLPPRPTSHVFGFSEFNMREFVPSNKALQARTHATAEAINALLEAFKQRMAILLGRLKTMATQASTSASAAAANSNARENFQSVLEQVQAAIDKALKAITAALSTGSRAAYGYASSAAAQVPNVEHIPAQVREWIYSTGRDIGNVYGGPTPTTTTTAAAAAAVPAVVASAPSDENETLLPAVSEEEEVTNEKVLTDEAIEANLEELRNMGFVNDTLNRKLVITYNGDMAKVIEYLLS